MPKKPAKKTAAKKQLTKKPISLPAPPSTNSKAARTYDAIAASLTKTRGVEASAMFGMPTFKVNGKAFAGLAGDAMIFKLSGAHHAAALVLSGAHLFEPMAGRPMKEWVQVPIAHAVAWSVLAKRARDYVAKSKK
jgi:hypothetical protein